MMRNFISFFVCSFLFLLALPACVGSDGGGGGPDGPKGPGLEFVGAPTRLNKVLTKDEHVIAFSVENKSGKDVRISKIELSGTEEPKFVLIAPSPGSAVKNCHEGQELAIDGKCPFRLSVSAESAGNFDVDLQIKITYMLMPEEEQRIAKTNLSGPIVWKVAIGTAGGKVVIGEKQIEELADGRKQWSVLMTNNSDKVAEFSDEWLKPHNTGDITDSENFSCKEIGAQINSAFNLESGGSCKIAYILEGDAKINKLEWKYKLGQKPESDFKAF